MLSFYCLPPAGTPAVLAVIAYLGSEEDALAHYAPLLSLPTMMKDVRSRPYPTLNEMLAATTGWGMRRVIKGSSFLPPLSVEYAEYLYSELLDFREQVPNAAGSGIMFEYISPRKTKLIGQRDTAFANRGSLLNIMFAANWTDPALDQVCRKWARDMGAKARLEVERSIRADGVDSLTKEGSTEYVNYDCKSLSGNATSCRCADL